MNKQFQNIIFIIDNSVHDKPEFTNDIIICLNDILLNNYNINRQIDEIVYMLKILDDIVFDDYNIKKLLIHLLSDVYVSLIIQQIDECNQHNVTIDIRKTFITEYFNFILICIVIIRSLFVMIIIKNIDFISI